MRTLTDLSPADPRRGLAVDEVLLESARYSGRGAIRFWVNDRSVIVGRSQTVEDEVDLAYAEAVEIPVLRRISGGGTVYHYPGNLNLSVILPTGSPVASVSGTFRFFGEAIATALAPWCKVDVEENLLLLGGLKVGGAAQARRGASLLYHTTLLFEPDEVPMERLLLAFRPGYAPRRVASHPRSTTTLLAVGRGAISPPRIIGAIGRSIGRRLGAPLREGSLEEEEQRRALELSAAKYGDNAWNRLH